MLPKWYEHSFIHSFILSVTKEDQPQAGHCLAEVHFPGGVPPGGDVIGTLRGAAQKGHLIQPVRGGDQECSLEEVIDTMAKSPRITGWWPGRERKSTLR